MDISQFPILAKATANDKMTVMHLPKALDEITKGLNAGAIPNPVFQSVKHNVARAIDQGWRNAVQEVYLARARGNTDAYPDEVGNLCYYSHPQAHTIPGLLKKIEKLPKSDVVDAAIAYLREVGPLGLAVVKLKDLAVKRQPKPDAATERKAKYDAPAVEGTAIGIVKDILTKVTDEAYDALLKMLVERNNKLLDRYIETNNAALEIDRRQRYDSKEAKIAREIGHNNPWVYRAVNAASEYKLDSKYTRNDNAEKLVNSEALQQADQTREHFIYKNLDKIAAILDAKGNFEDAKLIDRSVLNGLEGTIVFKFKDGSRFTVQNAVVYVVNSYGTRFNRFPLTFHNVVLPNGEKMARPSEERMNTVFAGKPEEEGAKFLGI